MNEKEKKQTSKPTLEELLTSKESLPVAKRNLKNSTPNMEKNPTKRNAKISSLENLLSNTNTISPPSTPFVGISTSKNVVDSSIADYNPIAVNSTTTTEKEIRLDISQEKTEYPQNETDDSTCTTDYEDVTSDYEIGEECARQSNKSNVKGKADSTISDSIGSRKSFAESAYEAISENEKVNEAIGTAYRSVKNHIIGNELTSKQSGSKKKKQKKKKYKSEPSQDAIPIESIWNGIVKTTSGQYVKILEILPINFNDFSINEKQDVVRSFGSIFMNGPTLIHLKTIVDKSNPARIISYIKSQCEEEKWKHGIANEVVDCAQDVINKIIDISNNSALSHRYFLSYRYEGNSSDPEDIYNDLETTKISIMQAFANCGNVVVDNVLDNATVAVGEILYYCLNRNSCREESLQQRINRVMHDYDLYNKSVHKNYIPKDVDFLGCKGLYFGKGDDYWYQDGRYKTSFTLMTKGYPSYVEPGWLNHFTDLGDGTELDVFIQKYPHDITEDSLSQYTRLVRVSAQNTNNSEKYMEKASKVQNNTFVVNKMKAQQDLFDVCTIITISADTIHDLRFKKTAIIKNLTKKQLYVEEAVYNCKEYYLSTLPLLYVPSAIFKRNKRNFLTESLESLYIYNSYEFFDPHGYVLGEHMNPNNKSVVSINNFSYPNPHIAIFGMSGSGKTFSTEVIARAMRIVGIRVFFILPVKGHEYKRGCQAVAGQYIQFGPGCNQRINICEIRPAQEVDRNIMQELGVTETSLLAQKITSLLTWLQLNRLRDPISLEEMDIITNELSAMYQSFGFTDDNDSAWLDKEHGIVRPSPIISDMYDRFKLNPYLDRAATSIKKYVTGSCKNMNGPTNIDYDNKYNCIDVDESKIPKDLLPAFLFTAYDWVYSLIKENCLSLDCVVFDEIWKLLVNEYTSDQVKEMIKILRGYGGAMITATQDINDYLDNPAGRAILSNTATKIIMHMEKPEGSRLAKELGLSESDVSTFLRFGRGQVLLLTGQHRVFVNIKSSDKELRDFTTDPKVLKQLYKSSE